MLLLRSGRRRCTTSTATLVLLLAATTALSASLALPLALAKTTGTGSAETLHRQVNLAGQAQVCLVDLEDAAALKNIEKLVVLHHSGTATNTAANPRAHTAESLAWLARLLPRLSRLGGTTLHEAGPLWLLLSASGRESQRNGQRKNGDTRHQAQFPMIVHSNSWVCRRKAVHS